MGQIKWPLTVSNGRNHSCTGQRNICLSVAKPNEATPLPRARHSTALSSTAKSGNDISIRQNYQSLNQGGGMSTGNSPLESDDDNPVINRTRKTSFIPPSTNESQHCADTAAIEHRFITTRATTESICEKLNPEDYGLQSMPEASPPKWHIAHATWFFETFILQPYLPNFKPYHPQFAVLFNSYYNGIGEQFSRPKRGLLSRPTLDEIINYRHIIEEQVLELLHRPHKDQEQIYQLMELGIHHEQQHQELLLTDLKHHFFQNPLYPAYQTAKPRHAKDYCATGDLRFFDYAGGLTMIGHDDSDTVTENKTSSSQSFCFDNEQPLHPYFVNGFSLANRLITNGEYLDFIEAGAYHSPLLWLADGWSHAQANQWRSPLYWIQQDGEWFEFTLHGLEPINIHKPVSHISYYEAQAFAEWSGKRLPTEQEWEFVAKEIPLEGNFQESKHFEALPERAGGARDYPSQLFGDLWEWTQSSYQPYPGFKTAAGAVGEYNGKFMCNQMVLKGGSCATPKTHIRTSYRNFFYPHDRWQFMGLRLAGND